MAVIASQEQTATGAVKSNQRGGFAQLWKNKKARAGLIIVTIFLLMGIFGPMLAPFNPSAASFLPNELPSAKHWLGTTSQGQDVFSQFLDGARISMMVGVVAGLLTTVIAVLLGIFTGYVRGVADEVISFITNVFLVIPGFPLMVILAAYIPVHGITPIIVVITITGWAWGTRVIRSQVMSLRDRDYILAARFAGDRTWRILLYEILPNLTSLVAASALGAAMSAILAESGLEFLGLGDPALVSWGTMLYWASTSNALLNNQWAWVLAPGLAIALLGMGLVLINFGIDEITNPRLRGGN